MPFRCADPKISQSKVVQDPCSHRQAVSVDAEKVAKVLSAKRKTRCSATGFLQLFPLDGADGVVDSIGNVLCNPCAHFLVVIFDDQFHNFHTP